MGGYLLIAIGLINLRYQSGQSNVVTNSLTIIIPGTLILIATWIPPLAKVLNRGISKIATLVIGLALIAYAVLN